MKLGAFVNVREIWKFWMEDVKPPRLRGPVVKQSENQANTESDETFVPRGIYTSHSVFSYPKQRLLTLDTTEVACLSLQHCFEEMENKFQSQRVLKLCQDTK